MRISDWSSDVCSSDLAFALPGQVDYRIDNEIGDMHALGPKIARQRFRQDALRGLGRREARETRLAAQGGGVAGDHQSTLAGGDHPPRRQPRGLQKRPRVVFKIAY